MCLITFAYDYHPEYRLILAGNRDEFYERPTRPAKFWREEGYSELLAGKDLKGGGTWLGVHKDGRWGALTNYRDFSIQKKDPPSRGELVLNYLTSEQNGKQFMYQISPRAEDYNGFNLLLGDKNGIYHFLNQEKVIRELKPGIHGLSNASLNTPWPKLKRANQRLKNLVEDDEVKKEALFDLLLDEKKAPDEKLPNTGLSHKMERAVSSIFIKTEDYGSRCSTVLLIDREGIIDFTERSFMPGNTKVNRESNYTITP